MKFSLVITTLNEGAVIGFLLSALEKQTRQPDEIVFVDGGSTDETVVLIRSWGRAKNVKLICNFGLTIAQGRNLGIKNSKGDVIVHTDAGCIPHVDWFEEITRPFEGSRVDIVSGFYRMTGESVFQKCIGPYFGVLRENVDDEKFLPSARSVSFRRETWEMVGGFSENLDRAGEDTLFNYLAKRIGADFHFQGEALVDWELPRDLKAAVKKLFYYSMGDAQVGIWWHPEQGIFTHNLKIIFIYLRYLFLSIVLFYLFKGGHFFSFLFLLFSFYFLLVVRKARFLKDGCRCFFPLLLMQVGSDIAVMFGFARGVFGKWRK